MCLLLGLSVPLAWHAQQGLFRRRLEAASYQPNPTGHEAAVLRYFAINDGDLFSVQGSAFATKLSVVRIEELTGSLKRLKYIEPIRSGGGWKLTRRGRRFVMAQGWA